MTTHWTGREERPSHTESADQVARLQTQLDAIVQLLYALCQAIQPGMPAHHLPDGLARFMADQQEQHTRQATRQHEVTLRSRTAYARLHLTAANSGASRSGATHGARMALER